MEDTIDYGDLFRRCIHCNKKFPTIEETDAHEPDCPEKSPHSTERRAKQMAALKREIVQRKRSE